MFSMIINIFSYICVVLSLDYEMLWTSTVVMPWNHHEENGDEDRV